MISVKALVLAHVLAWEGGLSTDPDDPGGVTKYGISSASYPNVEVRELTIDQARSIYEQDFWEGLELSRLPPEIAFVVMDASVNMGAYTAVKMLQEVVGAEPDGIMGPETRRKSKEMNPRYVVGVYTGQRIMTYTRLDQFQKYGKGWVKRSVATMNAALNMESPRHAQE